MSTQHVLGFFCLIIGITRWLKKYTDDSIIRVNKKLGVLSVKCCQICYILCFMTNDVWPYRWKFYVEWIVIDQTEKARMGRVNNLPLATGRRNETIAPETSLALSFYCHDTKHSSFTIGRNFNVFLWWRRKAAWVTFNQQANIYFGRFCIHRAMNEPCTDLEDLLLVLCACENLSIMPG